MKKVKLLQTLSIHGALMAKGQIVELDEKEALLLIGTGRAERVIREPDTPSPTPDATKRNRKGPSENRVIRSVEDRKE